MATYDDNLVNDRDKIRLMIGDTDDEFQMVTDNEIAFFLSENGDDLWLSAAMACDIIAAKFARDVNFRFSTMWQDSSDAYEHYMDRARQYRAIQASTTVAPVFSYGPGVNSEAPEIFWYGMHDNPPTPQVDD